MLSLALARWVVARLAAAPVFWLTGAVVAALWPAVVVFRPLALTQDTLSEAALIYEVAFLAVVVGGAAGATVLAGADWLLAPLGPLRRTGIELGVLLLCEAAFAGIALAPALALSARDADSSTLAYASSLLASALHVAAIALLLLRSPTPRAVLAPCLALSVWVLPALLAAEGPAATTLRHLLDAGAHHALSGVQAASRLAPVAGLLLAALLTARPIHGLDALRHPR